MSCHKLLVAAIITLIYNSSSVLCGIQQIDSREVEAFSRATSSVLVKAVNEFKIATIVVLYETNQNLFDNQIDGILRHANGEVVIKIEKEKVETRKMFTSKSYNGTTIFLMESLDVYATVKFSIFFYNGKKGNLFIAHVHQASAEKVLKSEPNMFTYFPKLHFIVSTNEAFVDLFAMVRFTPEDCGVTQMRIINRYSAVDMKWQQQMPPLTNDVNSYSCKLCFEVRERIDDDDYKKPINQTNKTENGPIKEILDQLKRFSNSNITLYRNAESCNKFQCPVLKFEPLREEEILIIPVFHNELFFIIPPGELYCDWEVLLLPFDTATWCLIIATFGSAFGFIIIIKLFGSATVRNFVFGRNVSSPALNVLSGFFGLSQVVLPGRNFARFLLTLFIIWSLIIRTGYQGVMFEHLQTDNRKPEMKEIRELVNRSFTYFVFYEHESLLQNDEELLEVVKMQVSSDYKKRALSNILMCYSSWFDEDLVTKLLNLYANYSAGALNELFLSIQNETLRNQLDQTFHAMNFFTWDDLINCFLHSPFKKILVADTFKIIHYNKNKNETNEPLLMLRQRIKGFYFGLNEEDLPFRREILAKAIANLTENGILNYLFEQMYDPKYLRPQPEEKEPEVLTLTQLAIGFKLHGAFIGLAIAVFMAEVIKEKVRLLKLLLVEIAIRSFYKILRHH